MRHDRLQTNSLGPALLTLLLLPILHHTEQNNPTGPRPRIVNVGSIAHQWTSLDEDLSSHPHILRRMSEAEYCTPASVILQGYPAFSHRHLQYH